MYDTVSSQLIPLFSGHTKVWYQDSLAIEEITIIRITTDTADRQTVENVLSHYIFIDLRSRSFDYYHTFSDTARPFKQYRDNNPMLLDDGWIYFNEHSLQYDGPYTALEDTLINNTPYKRIRFPRLKGKTPFETTCYFQSDRPLGLFSLDKTFSTQQGCPLTRVEDIPVGKSNPRSFEINFLADTLTEQELKVFAAWEKNAKLKPKKKK
ncbi:hypothetical protein [Flavisolibacter tropicus]|nr:hypothetical protein [Flavisolibacter tropicus]